MEKLFELMDNDSSGFIEKSDWIQFLTTTFESKELQRLQNSILNRCKGHKRNPSGMSNSYVFQSLFSFFCVCVCVCVCVPPAAVCVDILPQKKHKFYGKICMCN